jgi:hypothetical protein
LVGVNRQSAFPLPGIILLTFCKRLMRNFNQTLIRP